MTENEADAPAYRLSWARVTVLLVLAALPVVLTALAQPFLPDTVPLHYGMNGPDEWGPKGKLFVAAGIVSAIAFVLVGAYYVTERQRETGRQNWIVADRSLHGAPFPVLAGLIVVADCILIVCLFAAFQPKGFMLPTNVGALISGLVCGAAFLSLLAPGLYMLVTGKGLSLVNFHPGTSDLEKRTGADKQQARASGGLLLVLAGFVSMDLVRLVK